MVQREWREFFWKVLEEVEEIKEENNEIKEHDKNEREKKNWNANENKLKDRKSWKQERDDKRRKTYGRKWEKMKEENK